MDTNYVTVGGQSNDTMEEQNTVVDTSGNNNEDGTQYISDFSVQAICNGKNNAADFTYDLTQVPSGLMLEIDRGNGYELLENLGALSEGDSQFDICDSCTLLPGEEYAVRLKVVVDDVAELSSVKTIDTTEGSEFTSRVCYSTKLPNCGDSDGGRSYNQYGVVTFETSQRFQDTCVDDSTVKEYYCDENREVASEEFTCSGSCVMGRCTLN